MELPRAGLERFVQLVRLLRRRPLELHGAENWRRDVVELGEVLRIDLEVHLVARVAGLRHHAVVAHRELVAALDVELELGTASKRLHANPAIRELAVSTRLLLVPAVSLGAGGDRLPIRNLGWMEIYFYSELSFESPDHDFDMELSGSGENQLVARSGPGLVKGGVDGLDVVEDQIDEGEDPPKRIEGNGSAGLDGHRKPPLPAGGAEFLDEIDLEQGLSACQDDMGRG